MTCHSTRKRAPCLATLLLITAPWVVAACGTHPVKILPPPLTSTAELVAKGKASVVFAAQISTAVKSPMCSGQSVELVKIVDRNATLLVPIGGKRNIDIPANTYVYFAELDAGLYGITQVYCTNVGSHSVSYQFRSANVPFAYFEVKAGEVVDAGTVHVNMQNPNQTIFTQGSNPNAAVFVISAPDHHRSTALPEPLRGNVTSRLMKSNFALKPDDVTKTCSEHRLFRSTHGIVQTALSAFELQLDAPICAFVSEKKL